MFESFASELIEDPHHLFLLVTKVSVCATAVVLLLHFCASLVARSRGRTGKTYAPWNLWEKLLYIVAVLTVVELAVTSLYTAFVAEALGGWWLFAHMCGAGAFLGILPLLALTWAGASGFECCRASQAGTVRSERFPWLARVCFWLIVAGGVVVGGTMVLSMMPWFGTHGLTNLAELHRYSGLLVVVATVIHCYSTCMCRLRLG